MVGLQILTEEDGCLRHCVHQRLKLHGVTLNNLGCFFKRKGKLQAALHYLNKALRCPAAAVQVGAEIAVRLSLGSFVGGPPQIPHREEGVRGAKPCRVSLDGRSVP